MAENAKKAANAPQQDLNQLRKVRREKLAELVAAGKNPYEIVTYDQTEHTQDIKDNYEAYEGKNVSIAGRLMAKRVMGKASFANVQDLKGNIQVYITRDDLGEEAYKDFKKLDIGDIVGVKGFVFTTQKGERSIH
ncbi:MAG: lysine--tRNA ligase, partial [Lachnospiraceae bacterium]|nr:lysine--tRNA ligase [Lachnospiraceae bacterium]